MPPIHAILVAGGDLAITAPHVSRLLGVLGEARAYLAGVCVWSAPSNELSANDTMSSLAILTGLLQVSGEGSPGLWQPYCCIVV